MSKQPEHEGAQRFGGEFGPKRGANTTGVSLSTFKTLVWVSNIGGLLLVVFALEFLFVQQEFGMGLGFLIGSNCRPIPLKLRDKRNGRRTLNSFDFEFFTAGWALYFALVVIRYLQWRITMRTIDDYLGFNFFSTSP